MPQVQVNTLSGFLFKNYSNWKLNINMNYSDERGFTGSNESSLESLRQRFLVFNTTIQSIGWNNITLRVNTKQLANWQYFENNNTRFINQSASISSTYVFNDFKFSVKYEYSLRFGNILSRANELSFFDAEIEWRYKDLTFYLEGKNIFNINSNDQVDVHFLPEFTEIRSYQTFPGQILFGVGYVF